MSIRCACPHCGAAGVMPDEAVGRRVRCPSCRQPFVANPTEANTDPLDFESASESEPSDPESSPRHRKSSHLGIKLVASVVVLLGIAALAAAVYFSGVLSPAPPPAARKTVTIQAAAPTKPTARPPTKAVEPAPAARQWTGPAPKRDKPLATLTPTEPIDGIASLAGTPDPVGDLKFMPLTGLGRAVLQICWTSDADAFYHLDAAGTLKLIAYPTLQERTILRLNQPAGRLAIGDAGLIVTLPQLEEVWVINPNTFAVQFRVGLAGVQEVLAAPGLKEAIGICKEGGPVVIEFGGDGGKVSEAQIDRDALSKLPKEIDGFDQAALTADGKYLFALGTGEQLLRYRVEGRVLFLEDASVRIVSGTKRPVCVSPDGKWVAAPCPNGNLKAGDHATFVFAVSDLSKPAFTLASGPSSQAVGFDPAAGLVYAQNAQFALLTFDLTGAKKGQYAPGMSKTAPEVRQILPHPAGKKLLLLTTAGLYAVGPAEEK
jgi:hypothetical protein